MDTLTLVWIVTVVAAVVTGACCVGVLVVPRSAEAIVALLGISAFGFSAYSVVVISGSYERLDAVLYAFGFLVAGVVGGWAAASSLLEKLVREPAHLSLSTPDARVDRGPAVVLVSCLEPESYDPSITAGMLQSLADEELLEPSMGVLPFMFFAQKARYRAAGGTSPAAGQLRALAESVESELRADGIGRVDVATCSGENRLAARIKAAIDDGFSTVVVAEAVVAESLHLSAAKRETDQLRAELVDARIAYTDELGTSERIVNMLVARVLASAVNQDETGVVLVGHGQPEPRARRNPGFDERETAFLSRIRMRLVDEGIGAAHVRIAWAEWATPEVSASVRHLAALGCRRILVLPAVFAFDTLGTRLDLEMSVRQSRVDEAIAVITLAAWRDDPVVATEIAQRVREELGG